MRPAYPRRDDLRDAFVEAGITQTEVAARCLIARQHLCDILAGRRRLMPRLAREISMRTGIPLEVVLGSGDGDGQPAGVGR